MKPFQYLFITSIALLYLNQCCQANKDFQIKVPHLTQKYKEKKLKPIAINAKSDSQLSAQSHHHSMSSTSLIINVIADLCPHGMLPLAYGLMKGPTGIFPALVLMIFFGTISASTMTLYAKLARDTQSSTMGEIWGKLVNEKTKYIADISLFLLCFGCCVFYSAFVGDIFSALASAIGLQGILSKRYAILGIISATVILPLCQLDDVSALAFSSILGVFGIFYTFAFHVLRYFDNSYSPLNGGGKFFMKLSENVRKSWKTPIFSLWKINKDTLQLVNMLGVAFLAHYNSINYYKELENANLDKYSRAIQIGFTVAVTVFAGMMSFGYLLFGTTVQPLILNNFHRTDDILAGFARFATGLAITFAYPLMFAGLKTSLKSLLESLSPSNENTKNQKSVKKTATVKTTSTNNNMKLDVFKHITIPLVLSIITGIAMKCGEEDVSLVLGVVGSILGCTIAYILPGYLQLAYYKKYVPNVKFVEKLKNYFLMILGSVFSVLGVWITLDSVGSSHHH